MTASASDVAYDGIRNMLTRGELSPGQRLSQSRLARQLQCSPMPVVEAMRRLESEGLLVKQARKQARVRELSHDDVEGLYLLREAIESVTARLAPQRIALEESRVLQELAQAYENAWEDALLSDIHHRSAVVRDYYYRGPLVDIAQQLIGPNIKGVTSQLTFKMRGNTKFSDVERFEAELLPLPQALREWRSA